MIFDDFMPRNLFRLGALALVVLSGMSLGCGRPKFYPGLPDSATLGSPNGLRIARVVMHFHTPFSNDACDKVGLSADGVPNEECLQHVRLAVCVSKIDLMFLTDHPSHMVDYEFSSLLMPKPEDTVVSTADGPYYNIVGGCADPSFKPKLFVGFEGRAMGLGMKKHLETNATDRLNLYSEDGTNLGTLSTRLKNEADAIVGVPHSESRTLAWMQSLNPDVMEIYNYHANMDPKIREHDLGLAPFGKMGWLLTYLMDPYGTLTPDLAFLHFLEVPPIYASQWRAMIFSGYHVAGTLGTDSHENILSLHADDGERVDAHRRLTRMMSIHVLTPSTEPDVVKAAVRAGKFWNVFEGLGSPVGMNFTASKTGANAVVGGSLTLGGASATLSVNLPRLHSESPWGHEDPVIQTRIIEMQSASDERIVAQATGAGVTYTTSSTGVFRAEVRITPKHLREYMSDFPEVVDQDFPWIITNPIYLQ